MNEFKRHLIRIAFIAIIVINYNQTICLQLPCDRAGISNGWMLHMDIQEVDQITEACATTSGLYFRAVLLGQTYNGMAQMTGTGITLIGKFNRH